LSSGRASASTKQQFAVDLRYMKRGGLRGLASLSRLLERGSGALLRRGNQELELGDSAAGRGWEETLGEGEERLRSLIQHASDIVTLLEVDGTILYESPSIERILGYRPEELVGKNTFAYVHPQDLERVPSAFAAGLANPELRPAAEYRFRHKDGSWRYLESVGSNLLDDPDVGELVVNSRDVTERKKAEERLREAEARYRTLVEQIPAITYVEELSRNGKVLAYMSPQYEAMFGYSPETGTPHPEHWLEIVHPDDRERVLAEDARTDETLEPFRLALCRVPVESASTLAYTTDGFYKSRGFAKGPSERPRMVIPPGGATPNLHSPLRETPDRLGALALFLKPRTLATPIHWVQRRSAIAATSKRPRELLLCREGRQSPDQNRTRYPSLLAPEVAHYVLHVLIELTQGAPVSGHGEPVGVRDPLPVWNTGRVFRQSKDLGRRFSGQPAQRSGVSRAHSEHQRGLLDHRLAHLPGTVGFGVDSHLL
jgi:PAS domain S-box-containing protein